MIDKQEFVTRRQRLANRMQPESICVISAAKLQTRSRDTEFPFRQDSDFQYLTGFPEPDALLVLSNSQRNQGVQSWLFCLDKDPTAEIWHGRRFGPAIAKDCFGFDQTFTLDEAESKLLDLIDGHENLYVALDHCAETDELVRHILKQLRQAPKQSRQAPQAILDSRSLVHDMRLRKSSAEIAIMRQVGKISADAHKRAMSFCQAGVYEYQLEAELHHEFAMQGARYPAYGTIVGGGHNACILHYTENSDPLNDGDLVLIDAGGELEGYAADITRTFPVNGKFSSEQAQLYNLVLKAQTASLDLLIPGNTIKQATDKSIEVITQGLLDLGILTGTLVENIKHQTYREFYMHGLSHWLGLDVHDVGDYKVEGQDRPLETGMVFTVEPGVYIADTADVDERWKGIGIRIEDNVLITATGHEILTADVPKTIADIEKLMSGENSVG